ncbi:MAG: adenylosuccinate synthetase, partial [Candidatus Marinimicrobia bacterium]|nr:adenylosuccinate synthetase [Candidatus Neomarinimicrobiota bacterium]
ELKHFSSYSELPENAKNYISILEDYLESPIKMISVDPQREKIILR